MKLFHLEDVGTNVTEKTIFFLMYRLMLIRGFNLFLVIHLGFLPSNCLGSVQSSVGLLLKSCSASSGCGCLLKCQELANCMHDEVAGKFCCYEQVFSSIQQVLSINCWHHSFSFCLKKKASAQQSIKPSQEEGKHQI